MKARLQTKAVRVLKPNKESYLCVPRWFGWPCLQLSCVPQTSLGRMTGELRRVPP